MNSDINNRIVELSTRKVLQGFTWQDIADLVNDEFGTNLSSDACWYRANRHKNDFITTPEHIDTVSEEFEDNNYYNTIDEKTKWQDERNQANALYRRVSRENTLLEIAKEAVAAMAKSKPLTSLDHIYTSSVHNEALLLISDWHYGIEIENCFNIYNPDVCRNRVNELLNTVITKIKENKISTLHVLNLGDMIAGIIHLQLRINSRLDVMTQIMQVSEIIAEFLYELSKYVEIEYYQVLDNHSRLDPNKKEAMQLESLARIIPWYLEPRLKSAEKKYHPIHFNKNEIDQDIATFYINNEFLVVGVHGDDDKPGTIFSKLGRFIKDEPNLICSAHLHHPNFDTDNRTTRVSNGALMGTDDFAFSKRLDSMPSQTLITFKDVDNFGIDIDGIFILNSYINS